MTWMSLILKEAKQVFQQYQLPFIATFATVTRQETNGNVYE
jgi:hypothetical protein